MRPLKLAAAAIFSLLPLAASAGAANLEIFDKLIAREESLQAARAERQAQAPSPRPGAMPPQDRHPRPAGAPAAPASHLASAATDPAVLSLLHVLSEDSMMLALRDRSGSRIWLYDAFPDAPSCDAAPQAELLRHRVGRSATVSCARVSELRELALADHDIRFSGNISVPISAFTRGRKTQASDG